MAHKKSGGSTSLGRDSQPQYLGIKIHDGERAGVGNIIVRQRGTPIHPGKNVERAKDDSLIAAIAGIVSFTTRKMKRFDGSLKLRRFANVTPSK